MWVEEYTLEPFFTFRKCRAQVGGAYLEPFPAPYSATQVLPPSPPGTCTGEGGHTAPGRVRHQHAGP